MKNFPYHPKVTAQLENILTSPSQVYIFHGETGLGKYRAACFLTSQLLNQAWDEVRTLAHPNLTIVTPLEGKKNISIAQIHTLGERLWRTTVDTNLPRCVIIAHAQSMGVEAANALLKNLEEPPPNTIFFLVSSDLEHMLPTIRSRAQIIYFSPPPTELLNAFLQAQHVADETISQLVTQAHGKPMRLLELIRSGIKPASLPDVSQQFLTSTITKRFVIAKDIAAQNQAGEFLEELSYAIRDQFTILEGAKMLESLLQSNHQLAHNLNSRLVIENLALQLGETQ